MYRSKLRKFKNINIFTSEEKVLIEKFIKFDEECFHQIDLNNREIYWVDAWELKIDYLRNTNNLLDFIYNLYNIFNNYKEFFYIKINLEKFHQFLNFFFIWHKIYNFYGSTCEKYFSSLNRELESMYKTNLKNFYNL